MKRRVRYHVHPACHEIVKLFPHNPPERHEIVLVDGERRRVVRCDVDWGEPLGPNDYPWTIRKLVVEEA